MPLAKMNIAHAVPLDPGAITSGSASEDEPSKRPEPDAVNVMEKEDSVAPQERKSQMSGSQGRRLTQEASDVSGTEQNLQQGSAGDQTVQSVSPAQTTAAVPSSSDETDLASENSNDEKMAKGVLPDGALYGEASGSRSTEKRPLLVRDLASDPRGLLEQQTGTADQQSGLFRTRMPPWLDWKHRRHLKHTMGTLRDHERAVGELTVRPYNHIFRVCDIPFESGKKATTVKDIYNLEAPEVSELPVRGYEPEALELGTHEPMCTRIFELTLDVEDYSERRTRMIKADALWNSVRAHLRSAYLEPGSIGDHETALLSMVPIVDGDLLDNLAGEITFDEEAKMLERSATDLGALCLQLTQGLNDSDIAAISAHSTLRPRDASGRLEVTVSKFCCVRVDESRLVGKPILG